MGRLVRSGRSRDPPRPPGGRSVVGRHDEGALTCPALFCFLAAASPAYPDEDTYLYVLPNLTYAHDALEVRARDPGRGHLCAPERERSRVRPD